MWLSYALWSMSDMTYPASFAALMLLFGRQEGIQFVKGTLPTITESLLFETSQTWSNIRKLVRLNRYIQTGCKCVLCLIHNVSAG